MWCARAGVIIHRIWDNLWLDKIIFLWNPVEYMKHKKIIKIGIGKFGTMYAGIIGQHAINFLLHIQNGEVIGAFKKDGVGLIDIVWGKCADTTSEGYGLAHIREKHPEMIAQLSNIIQKGIVYTQGTDRVLIIVSDYGYGNHVAAVRLDWDGEAKTWLVTAFNEP